MYTVALVIVALVVGILIGGCAIEPWGQRVAQGTLYMWVDAGNAQLAEEVRLSASQCRELAAAMYDVATRTGNPLAPQTRELIEEAARLDARTQRQLAAAWLRSCREDRPQLPAPAHRR